MATVVLAATAVLSASLLSACAEEGPLEVSLAHVTPPDAMIALARVEASDRAAALEHIGQAVSVARDLKLHGKIQLAAAWHAHLSGKDDGTTAAVLSEHDAHIPHHEKMEGRFVLWKATRDSAHLVEAKRLLDYLVENAPEEYRDSMIESIPLNREIRDA